MVIFHIEYSWQTVTLGSRFSGIMVIVVWVAYMHIVTCATNINMQLGKILEVGKT